MLMQFATQLIPVLTAGFIGFLTYYLSKLIDNGGALAFLGFSWLLDATPALAAFIEFITISALFNMLVLCTFGRSSKHIVLSLDILYFLSLLLLIIYHNFKQPQSSPVRTA